MDFVSLLLSLLRYLDPLGIRRPLSLALLGGGVSFLLIVDAVVTVIGLAANLAVQCSPKDGDPPNSGLSGSLCENEASHYALYPILEDKYGRRTIPSNQHVLLLHLLLAVINRSLVWIIIRGRTLAILSTRNTLCRSVESSNLHDSTSITLTKLMFKRSYMRTILLGVRLLLPLISVPLISKLVSRGIISANGGIKIESFTVSVLQEMAGCFFEDFASLDQFNDFNNLTSKLPQWGFHTETWDYAFPSRTMCEARDILIGITRTKNTRTLQCYHLANRWHGLIYMGITLLLFLSNASAIAEFIGSIYAMREKTTIVSQWVRDSWGEDTVESDAKAFAELLPMHLYMEMRKKPPNERERIVTALLKYVGVTQIVSTLPVKAQSTVVTIDPQSASSSAWV